MEKSTIVKLAPELKHILAMFQKPVNTGKLNGPDGNSLAVCTIWMSESATGITKFITMYPDKKE
jgi:hypothetical protein